MNIREISDIFKDTADNITAIKSYNFGWASDRVRQGNTEDFQELNEFPRVFFAVPTITGSDQTRKQDTYQVTLFFDDLLGYDNEGDEDPTLQIDKWANLQQYANYFIQRLNKIKQSILPNYLFIPEAPSITFDSFTGIQRMITVQLSFNLVVPTNCDPGVITLVQCIANIVTSSNLTASLKSIIKFAASLEGRATVTADINLVQKVASSLNANASLVSDINFVQKVQASLLTSAIVTGDITIPKLLNASLLATGTTTADLTVTAPGLLLDLYPSAAAAYSLRKLRTAYTGSAIRVRASTSGAEGDVSFDVNSTISASSTVTVTAVGTSGLSIGQQVTFSTFWNAGGTNQNAFVVTWYDQSGNANNATQTTQANQPQIVSTGTIFYRNSKPTIRFNGTSSWFNTTLNNPFSFTGGVSLIHLSYKDATTFKLFETILSAGTTEDSLSNLEKTLALGYNNSNLANPIPTISTDIWKPSGIQYNGTVNLNSTHLVGYYISNWSLHRDTGISIIRFNGNDIPTKIYNTSVPQALNTNPIKIGVYNTILASSFFAGEIQEIIAYPTNQSPSRTGIETNINTHYGIY